MFLLIYYSAYRRMVHWQCEAHDANNAVSSNDTVRNISVSNYLHKTNTFERFPGSTRIVNNLFRKHEEWTRITYSICPKIPKSFLLDTHWSQNNVYPVSRVKVSSIWSNKQRNANKQIYKKCSDYIHTNDIMNALPTIDIIEMKDKPTDFP